MVRIHWTLPVIFLMYVLRGAVEPGGGGLVMGWYALTMAALFFTVLIHELGHCFMAIRVGGYAHQILLWPLGGLAYAGSGEGWGQGDPKQDIKILVAGPATHIPMALACAGILLASGAPWSWAYLNLFDTWWPYGFTFWQAFTLSCLRLQIILFLFNLLVPAYPLDGGQIFANVLKIRYGRRRAAQVLSIASIPIGVAILIWAFLQREILFAFIGAWVLFEAWQIRRLLQWHEIERHPLFAGSSEYSYVPEAEPRRKKPGFFQRWRQKRAKKRLEREARETARFEDKVDAVLEKVSREGINSLTPAEKAVLDEASKRAKEK